MNSGYAVDLRAEVDRTVTLFQGRGGVVHVRANGDAPQSIFARKLRLTMTEMGWRHVQIHPSNSNTHYVSDILVQITQSLGLDLPSGPAIDRSVTVEVGTRILTEGSVDISDVAINIVGDSFDGAHRERGHAQSVGRALSAALLESRVAIVFLGMEELSSGDLRRIRHDLWDGVLAQLTGQGLAIVDISNPSALDLAIWPPQPDLAYDLPISLTDEAARADAVAELADIALKEAIVNTPDEAILAARLLVSTTTSIVGLHAALGRAIAGWPPWDGAS